ncbi:hypothetical protein OG21DRAFT_1383712, partial [Imleria badia]
LRLPNGQIAHSEFTELEKPQEEVRMARNVKVVLNGVQCLAEVHYFTQLINGPQLFCFKNVAIVTLYSFPDPILLRESSRTFVSCTKMGEESLSVIDITTIKSVVAMIPH